MDKWWWLIIICSLSTFTVIVGMLIARNRFGVPTAIVLTFLKELVTFVLAGASLGVAYLAYQQSLDNGDIQNVVSQIANVSSSLERQAAATSNEVEVLANSVSEQKRQTVELAIQARESQRQSGFLAGRMRLDRTGFLDVSAGEISGYALGVRPRIVVTIRNGSSSTNVEATVFWAVELLDLGKPNKVWTDYRTSQRRVVINVPPGGTRPYIVPGFEPFDADQINALSSLRAMLRLSAVIEFVDSNRKVRRAYLCRYWTGAPGDVISNYCETPKAT